LAGKTAAGYQYDTVLCICKFSREILAAISVISNNSSVSHCYTVIIIIIVIITLITIIITWFIELHSYKLD